MPRMWSPPEHNPLGLRPAKIRISAGGNLDPSLRAARAFLSSGTLCSPPGLLVNASKEEDGVDFVTALIRPSQDDKKVCAEATSLTGLDFQINKNGPLPLVAHCQESIIFAIRHGLTLRGWTMLGKSTGVRVGTLFVKTLDLSQAKNSVDAFKLEVAFTGRTEGSKHEIKLSLEPLKVTTRRFEPKKRGHDGEIILLPSLEPAIILDNNHEDNANINEESKNNGDNCEGNSPSDDDDDDDVRAAWLQAHGLVLPHHGPLKLTTVARRGEGNAEDGGLLSWYADVEGDGIASLLVDRAEVVPEVTLLADEPTEKKMNKSDGDRVLAEAKAALVALGLPIGLVGNPDNTNTASMEKDLTAEELEAEKSRRIGECETWTRGHELGRAAPIWTNGKGVAQSMARVVTPQANDNYTYDAQFDYNYSNQNGSFGNCNPVAKGPAKWINKCWVDLERIIRNLPTLSLNSAPASLPRIVNATVLARSSSRNTGRERDPSALVASTEIDSITADMGSTGRSAPQRPKMSKIAKKSAAADSANKNLIAQPPVLVSRAGCGDENAPPVDPEKCALADASRQVQDDKHTEKHIEATKPQPLQALPANQPVAAKKGKKKAALQGEPPAKKNKKNSATTDSSTATTTSLPSSSPAEVEKTLKVPSAAELSKMKMPELKAICKKHGITPLPGKGSVIAQLTSLA